MAPCACVLRSLPYHQVSLCVGRLSRPWYKKVIRTPFLKYYAIERRVCPNIELRSNCLAVINFFGIRTRNLFDRHFKGSLLLFTHTNIVVSMAIITLCAVCAKGYTISFIYMSTCMYMLQNIGCLASSLKKKKNWKSGHGTFFRT